MLGHFKFSTERALGNLWLISARAVSSVTFLSAFNIVGYVFLLKIILIIKAKGVQINCKLKQ